MTAIHESKDDILNSLLKSNTKNQDHEHQNHSTSFFFSFKTIARTNVRTALKILIISSK